MLDAKIAGYVKTPLKNLSLLDISYRNRDCLNEVLSDPATLAVIDFGEKSQFKNQHITIGTAPLAGCDLIEVWQTDQKIDVGKQGDIYFRKTDSFIFGQIIVDSKNKKIDAVTKNIYKQITALQQAHDYPKMIRIWNYLPWIIRHDDDMERYQSFCVGRHQAIDTTRGFESHLPAATAVGTHDDNLIIYFIAARVDGVQIENPRQVSAFDYPEKYAPKSPAFSRAMVKQWGDFKHLYISGTASILGHETQHKNKLLEQLDECLNNIDTLVAEANSKADIGITDASRLTAIKIYLRDDASSGEVLKHARLKLGDGVQIFVLLADICRPDLMLEIEGVFSEV